MLVDYSMVDNVADIELSRIWPGSFLGSFLVGVDSGVHEGDVDNNERIGIWRWRRSSVPSNCAKSLIQACMDQIKQTEKYLMASQESL